MNRLLVLALGLTWIPSAMAQTRLPLAQASAGMPLAVTHDYDRIVQFDQDRIVDVWLSNPVLFNPRFTKGGNILVIQSNGSPKELRILPQLGRTLATLTVELQSGRLALFYLQYTPKPPKQALLSLYSPYVGPVLRPALAEYQERAAQRRPTRTGVVTQEGFIPPVKGVQSASPCCTPTQTSSPSLPTLVPPTIVGEPQVDPSASPEPHP